MRRLVVIQTLELLHAYQVKLQSQLRLLEFWGLAKQAEIEPDRVKAQRSSHGQEETRQI